LAFGIEGAKVQNLYGFKKIPTFALSKKIPSHPHPPNCPMV
jgi:hypothetical protein